MYLKFYKNRRNDTIIAKWTTLSQRLKRIIIDIWIYLLSLTVNNVACQTGEGGLFAYVINFELKLIKCNQVLYFSLFLYPAKSPFWCATSHNVPREVARIIQFTHKSDVFTLVECAHFMSVWITNYVFFSLWWDSQGVK